MLSVMLVLMSHVAADEGLQARGATLAFHVERLAAIEVPDELAAEKEAKLAALKESVAKGAATVDAFSKLYYDIDAVRMWLWKNAKEQPRRAEGTFEETDAAWRVTTPQLTLEVNRADLAMRVKTPATEWVFARCGMKDIRMAKSLFGFLSAKSISAESFNTGYSVGMTMTLKEFPDAPGLEFYLTANLIGNEVVFELAARDGNDVMHSVGWPTAIETGATSADLAVIPRMQGMIVPGDWPQEIPERDDLCNSRHLYMPWWGQIRDGHGVMTILETSDDAGAIYGHPAGGPTRIAPRWYASLGRFSYLRSARYIFDDHATYVTMAKRYRRFVQERGEFVSLREKLARTPSLAEVIGKPVVHLGALYHFVQEASLFNKERIEANHALVTFDELAKGLHRLKEKGIANAYVHLDGWGFYGYDNGHPDVLPVGQEQGGWEGLKRFADTCTGLGYLFAVHDQYRDFYLNAVSFDDRLAATRIDGSREETSTWCGGPQTILNPLFAPGYVRHNHDLFASHGITVRGAYLDVFAVVPLEESAQPAHPVTRSECAEYRRNCFDLLRARGYVVSSEEPADYLVRSLDLVHHGPYSTSPNIGGGDATGIPVPLFNLVYHDSILLPWSMTEDGGWGIPNGDAGRLHCLLNAGLPYVDPGADDVTITRVREAAEVATRLAHAEMVDHRFLDDTRRKQETEFSDGTVITVDFGTKEYDFQDGLVRKLHP